MEVNKLKEIMTIKELPKIFLLAMPVLKAIEQAGFEAYFVGGAVRDVLLGHHIHDIDIATSAYPEEVKALFDKTIDTGLQHGTVTVLYEGESYEITTFRTESGYQDFRRPDKVTFVQNLDEDLKRRDFTINALAMNTRGEVIDLFNGLDDLKHHVIRAVGDPEQRFHEDALRMLRAVRFMSQLKFTIEARTKQAILDHHQLLHKISIERIREEFVKMGLGPDSRAAFAVFIATKLVEACPDFAGQSDHLAVYPQLEYSPDIETSFWTIIVLLLKLPSDRILTFMRDWKNSNAMAHAVNQVVNCFDVITDHTPSNLELFRAGEVALINAIDVARILGEPVDAKVLVDRYTALPIKSQKELAIDGSYLVAHGMRPGPGLGELLMQLTAAVIDGKVANTPEAIGKLADEIVLA